MQRCFWVCNKILTGPGPGVLVLILRIYNKDNLFHFFPPILKLSVEFLKLVNSFYCPQTKFLKVIFLQVSVHRGGQVPPWGGTPSGRYTLRQVHLTPKQVHPPGRYTPRQVPPPGRYIGIWSTSGQYTSHCNAFLLVTVLPKETACNK